MMRTAVTKKHAPKRRALKLPQKRDSRWSVRSAGGLKIVEAPVLAQLDWLVHGFSTRVGGVSKLASPLAGAGGKTEPALNLGFTGWDSRESVLENRKRFFRVIRAAKMRAVTMRQIHSDIVHVVAGRNAGARARAPKVDAPKADALITRERGVLLAVQTADCIPILLADTKRKAVAAIHAGWRGTLQRIAEKTLGRMRMEFGTQPKDVVAALGPGIGGCCYEVGPEVASKFAAKFANAREWFKGPFDAVASGENDPNWLPWLTMKPPGHAPPPVRAYLDLMAANRSILMAVGVPAESVSTSGFCTNCQTNLFFSYRRERATGRMMAAIGIV